MATSPHTFCIPHPGSDPVARLLERQTLVSPRTTRIAPTATTTAAATARCTRVMLNRPPLTRSVPRRYTKTRTATTMSQTPVAISNSGLMPFATADAVDVHTTVGTKELAAPAGSLRNSADTSVRGAVRAVWSGSGGQHVAWRDRRPTVTVPPTLRLGHSSEGGGNCLSRIVATERTVHESCSGQGRRRVRRSGQLARLGVLV